MGRSLVVSEAANEDVNAIGELFGAVANLDGHTGIVIPDAELQRFSTELKLEQEPDCVAGSKLY